MNTISENRIAQIVSVEDTGNQIRVVDVNGHAEEFNKNQGRYSFTEEESKVVVLDVLLNNSYWAVANTLKDGTGTVISNVNTATDKAAIETYLGAFVGV